VIRTHGLTKAFGPVTAVDGVDLDVREGDVYGFLGANGSGKTTTVRMVLGLVLATKGTIELFGESMPAAASTVLPRVGALVEGPAAYRHLSGRTNLATFDAAGRRGTGPDRRGRIGEVLEQVGLDPGDRRPVRTYSLGMRQRLGIAAALLGNPDVLVLDEPTNGLDPQGMREIRRLLRRLADDGTTVFVSSHLLVEVEAMCDRVGVLAHGKLLAEGPPGTLRGFADHARIEVDDVARALAVIASIDGVELLEDGSRPGAGVVRVRLAGATTAAVNGALVSSGIAVSALTPERSTLEDVFIALVEGEDVPR